MVQHPDSSHYSARMTDWLHHDGATMYVLPWTASAQQIASEVVAGTRDPATEKLSTFQTSVYEGLRLSARYDQAVMDDENIQQITSTVPAGIKLHSSGDWNHRQPLNYSFREIGERISLNAHARPELIAKLDDFCLRHGACYKTPEGGLLDGWLRRHDPVTIYFDKMRPLSGTMKDEIAELAHPYIRHTHSTNLMTGTKIADGIFEDKEPDQGSMQALLDRADTLDPAFVILVDRMIDRELGYWRMSAGTHQSLEMMMDSFETFHQGEHRTAVRDYFVAAYKGDYQKNFGEDGRRTAFPGSANIMDVATPQVEAIVAQSPSGRSLTEELVGSFASACHTLDRFVGEKFNVASRPPLAEGLPAGCWQAASQTLPAQLADLKARVSEGIQTIAQEKNLPLTAKELAVAELIRKECPMLKDMINRARSSYATAYYNTARDDPALKHNADIAGLNKLEQAAEKLAQRADTLAADSPMVYTAPKFVKQHFRA